MARKLYKTRLVVMMQRGFTQHRSDGSEQGPLEVRRGSKQMAWERGWKREPGFGVGWARPLDFLF